MGSDAEKACREYVRCGPRRRARANHCSKCRNIVDDIRTEGLILSLGRVWEIPVYCPGRCPACRWRELGPGFCLERGNLSFRKCLRVFVLEQEEEPQVVKSREGLSTGYGAQGRTVS